MEFFLSSTTSFCFSCTGVQSSGDNADRTDDNKEQEGQNTNTNTGPITSDPEEKEESSVMTSPTAAPTRQDLYGVIMDNEDLQTLQSSLEETSMIETLSRQQGAVHT